MEGVGGRWHGLLHVHTPQHPSCAVPAQLALRSLLRTTLHVSTCASTQPVLGVFQKLIASKAHDHEGFNLLSALVSHLDYQAQMAQVGNRCLPLPRAALRSQTAQVGWVLTHQPGLWLAATSRVGENVSAQWSYGGAEEGSACWAGGRTQGSGSGSERAAGARRSVTLEPLCSSSHPPTLLAPAPPPPPAPPRQYMPTIWGLLFSRLQSSRTPKFTRSLLLFMALFVCKRVGVPGRRGWRQGLREAAAAGTRGQCSKQLHRLYLARWEMTTA